VLMLLLSSFILWRILRKEVRITSGEIADSIENTVGQPRKVVVETLV